MHLEVASLGYTHTRSWKMQTNLAAKRNENVAKAEATRATGSVPYREAATKTRPNTAEPGDGSLTLSRLAASIPAAEAARAGAPTPTL
mgnify:CR=1 FL=1